MYNQTNSQKHAKAKGGVWHPVRIRQARRTAVKSTVDQIEGSGAQGRGKRVLDMGGRRAKFSHNFPVMQA